MADVKDTK